jgi:hypothetical protein
VVCREDGVSDFDKPRAAVGRLGSRDAFLYSFDLQWKRSRSPAHEAHNRFYKSNGPDVKVRGSASLVAEKCLQLARDAQVSGDLIAAEGYLQHAEHYNRVIAAVQEQ